MRLLAVAWLVLRLTGGGTALGVGRGHLLSDGVLGDVSPLCVGFPAG